MRPTLLPFVEEHFRNCGGDTEKFPFIFERGTGHRKRLGLKLPHRPSVAHVKNRAGPGWKGFTNKACFRRGPH